MMHACSSLDVFTTLNIRATKHNSDYTKPYLPVPGCTDTAVLLRIVFTRTAKTFRSPKDAGLNNGYVAPCIPKTTCANACA